ncbi:MAG: hypothetical protein AB7U41_01325 [Dongiaceae bacterium]
MDWRLATNRAVGRLNHYWCLSRPGIAGLGKNLKLLAAKNPYFVAASTLVISAVGACYLLSDSPAPSRQQEVAAAPAAKDPPLPIIQKEEAFAYNFNNASSKKQRSLFVVGKPDIDEIFEVKETDANSSPLAISFDTGQRAKAKPPAFSINQRLTSNLRMIDVMMETSPELKIPLIMQNQPLVQEFVNIGNPLPITNLKLPAFNQEIMGRVVEQYRSNVR